jgi:hypothetical protein
MSDNRVEQTFFNDPAIDRLVGTVIALAAEVYVLRDRLGRLERRSASTGQAPSIEAEAADANVDRERFVAHILAPLLGTQQARGID